MTSQTEAIYRWLVREVAANGCLRLTLAAAQADSMHWYSVLWQTHATARMDANNQTSDIYTTMRQSSGSNFFLNRKDTIVIKGFLSKKSNFF